MAAGALLGLPLVALAQAPDPEPLTLASLGLKGQLLYKNFSHFSETPNDDRLFRNEGQLQVEWERRLAAWADARLLVEARVDDNGYARGLTTNLATRARARG